MNTQGKSFFELPDQVGRKHQGSTKPPQTKSTKKAHRNKKFSLLIALRHLDIRFPWFKLVAVCLVGILAILDLLDLTISRAGDPQDRIKVAPMSRHVRATNRVLEDKMLVALTFDDGPSPETTPRLLQILTEKDATATFFMLGYMIRSFPDLARSVKNEYHEVANHTMYHQNFHRLSPASTESDIAESKGIFTEVFSQPPALTRPPYGNYTDVARVAADTPIILWSVDSLDWKNRDKDAILSTVMGQVHDGAIILMHDIYPTTVDAVPAIIDNLRQAGYEFATVSEIAQKRGLVLEKGALYYNFRP